MVKELFIRFSEQLMDFLSHFFIFANFLFGSVQYTDRAGIVSYFFIASDLKSNKHRFVHQWHDASVIIPYYRLAFASQRVLSVYM